MTKFNDYVPQTLENGSKALLSADGQMVVEGGEAFTRVGMQLTTDGKPAADPVRWLVGELEGVRVYFDGVTVLMTKRDVYL